jgi:hypothetical protein
MPTASNVTADCPARNSPTAVPDTVGTSARSLKRMSVRPSLSALARSYSIPSWFWSGICSGYAARKDSPLIAFLY